MENEEGFFKNITFRRSDCDDSNEQGSCYIPILYTYSNEKLQEALYACIENENYERAAIFRDEIARRKKEQVPLELEDTEKYFQREKLIAERDILRSLDLLHICEACGAENALTTLVCYKCKRPFKKV